MTYAECHYAECRYAECHYAECRGAVAGTSTRNAYPKLDPLVEQPAVVELAEEAGLGDGVGGVAHLAPAASHITEVVVPLLPQDG